MPQAKWAPQKYNLGPNSTLVMNNLTDPSNALQAAGLHTFPMVSSFPYPPQFIDWMRAVFATPKPFVDALVAEVVAHRYTGVNMCACVGAPCRRRKHSPLPPLAATGSRRRRT